MSSNEIVKPRALHVATWLLWLAVALQTASTFLDFKTTKSADGGRIAMLVLEILFIAIWVASAYFFWLGRRWARTATLVLFIMGLVGLAIAYEMFFGEAALLAWMALVQLLLQGVALCLGYSEPAASYFRSGPANDAAMRAILPVGRSGWAIAAGYLALFSILLVPAPFALFCGVMAIRDIRRNPSKHGMGRAIFGVTMGSIGVAVILVLLWIRASR